MVCARGSLIVGRVVWPLNDASQHVLREVNPRVRVSRGGVRDRLEIFQVGFVGSVSKDFFEEVARSPVLPLRGGAPSGGSVGTSVLRKGPTGGVGLRA